MIAKNNKQPHFLYESFYHFFNDGFTNVYYRGYTTLSISEVRVCLVSNKLHRMIVDNLIEEIIGLTEATKSIHSHSVFTEVVTLAIRKKYEQQ